jgi:hypothetical protein
MPAPIVVHVGSIFHFQPVKTGRSAAPLAPCHATQYNDIQYGDIQQSDIKNDATQYNDIQYDDNHESDF